MPPPRPLPWLLLLLALALSPLLPVLLGDGVFVLHDIWISDLLHAMLPYRAFLGDSLREGHFPLWMPGVWSGTPFLAQIETGALWPPGLLLYGLLDPFRALNLSFALDSLLAAGGSWVLARRVGRAPAGAALAGLVFAWQGFMVGHLRHPNMHAAAALLPWALWALEGLLRERRGGAALALILGLQLTAGHPQISWITGIVLATRTLHWMGAARGGIGRGLQVAAATALGGGLAGALLLPVARFTAASYLQTTPDWAFATAFPFRPADLLVLLAPSLVGAMETYDYQGAQSLPWGNYGYLGLLPLGLALWAGTRRGGRALLLGTAVALLLVLGASTPLYRLCWELLPGMALFRFPNRFLLVVGLGVALLAGQGLDALLARLPRQGPLLAVLALLLTLLDLQTAHRPRMPWDDADAWRQPTELRTQLEAAGIEGYVTVLHELDLWERAFHAARGVGADLAPYRLTWRIPIGQSGLLMGIESTLGYTRMVQARSGSFWQRYNTDLLAEVHQPELPTAADPRPSAALRALWDAGGVEAILTAFPIEGEGLERLSGGTMHLSRNPAALPHAWLATRWQPADSLAEAADWTLAPGHRASPAIEGATGSKGAATVTALSWSRPSPNEIEVQLPKGAPAGQGILIESWDPGWSATVDEAPAEIHIASGYQMAVALPAGAKRLRLRYWPEGLTEGLGLSLGAAVLWLAWALSDRRKRPLGRQG